MGEYLDDGQVARQVGSIDFGLFGLNAQSGRTG